MSVNFGGVASGAGEETAEELDGPVPGMVGELVTSGVAEVDGRVPARVADGAWARAIP